MNVVMNESKSMKEMSRFKKVNGFTREKWTELYIAYLAELSGFLHTDAGVGC